MIQPLQSGDALLADVRGAAPDALSLWWLGQSDAQGALPSLYAATMPDLESGTYVGPDRLFETRGHPKVVSTSGAARDLAAAARLWELAELLTGVRYL